jgi:uncharacterized protein (DUF952 family)
MRNRKPLFFGLLITCFLLSNQTYSLETDKEFLMTDKVYKILRANEWETASNTGKIVTDLDNVDGFIHLSSAVQLAATLSFFFQDSDEVFLLQLDLEKLDKDKLLYEEPYPNKGKRKSAFPHLYSELRTDQIANVWILERGAFNLPEEVLLQVENPPID